MKALLCSLTVSLLALQAQTASADPAPVDNSGLTFGLSPLGVALGDVSGMMAAVHLGWRVNSELALQFEVEGIMRPTGAEASSDNSMGSAFATNEDIAGIGTRWWPMKDTWTSASLGVGRMYSGSSQEVGPALLVRAGQRLGQHTSLVLSARAVDYGDLNSALGAGLEFEWGSPSH